MLLYICIYMVHCFWWNIVFWNIHPQHFVSPTQGWTPRLAPASCYHKQGCVELSHECLLVDLCENFSEIWTHKWYQEVKQHKHTHFTTIVKCYTSLYFYKDCSQRFLCHMPLPIVSIVHFSHFAILMDASYVI